MEILEDAVILGEVDLEVEIVVVLGEIIAGIGIEKIGIETIGVEILGIEDNQGHKKEGTVAGVMECMRGQNLALDHGQVQESPPIETE